MGTIDPGEGFRLLVEGDPIPSVVDYCFDGEWIPRRADHHVGECWSPRCYLPMRVKIAPQNNVHTGGPYIAIEVHRAALAEVERLKAELNDKQPQPEPELEWFDLTPFDEHQMRSGVDWWWDGVEWRLEDCDACQINRIGTIKRLWKTSAFRCLLKDAPTELLAKAARDSRCIHTFDCGSGDHSDACPASVPDESPDDWVTQDRVPVRQNVDRVSWNGDDVETSIVPFDASVGKMHGYTNTFGQTLHVFCRRKDLPPLPQQPKTETVVFYEVIVWRDGTRKLEWIECPSEGSVGTGETCTRTITKER